MAKVTFYGFVMQAGDVLEIDQARLVGSGVSSGYNQRWRVMRGGTLVKEGDALCSPTSPRVAYVDGKEASWCGFWYDLFLKAGHWRLAKDDGHFECVAEYGTFGLRTMVA